MREFRMPSLGADMEHGTIIEWLVAPGDRVKRGDVVAVVDTEKSTIDVEIFDSGVIDELIVGVGEQVPVGAVLANVREVEEVAATAPIPSAAPTIRPRPTPTPTSVPTPAPAWTPERRPVTLRPAVRSPLVRRLAAERHVDLAAVTGSGPGGQITRHDVEVAAHEPPKVAGVRVRSSPYARRLADQLGVELADAHGTGPRGAIVADDIAVLARRPRRPPPARGLITAPRTGEERTASIRQRIGELMSRSNREIPHYHLTLTTDVDEALAWMRSENEHRAVAERILPAALLLHAAARALRDVPGFNGFFVDGRYQAASNVHLGVAISLRGGGLVAPAIRDADLLDPATTMAELRDLVVRARSGRLRSSEMSDPTATVTDLGDRSADAVFGIIHPPQVAIIGFGQISERPVAVDGACEVRSTITMTLAADHRVTDGHDGVRLLRAIETHLHDTGRSR